MKQPLVLLLMFPSLVAIAQERLDTTVIRRIRSEALEHSGVMTIAFHLTDASGPRLTNSPGLRRAQQWAISALKLWGIPAVTLEPWGAFGKGWELKKDYLAMVAPYYQPLVAFPGAWTKGSGGPFRVDVVLYHPKDSLMQDSLRGKLRGKLALMPSTAQIRFPFTPEAERYSDSSLEAIAHPATPPQRQPRPPTQAVTAYKPPPRPLRKASLVPSYRFFSEEGVLGTLSSSAQDRDGTVFVQGGDNHQWADSLWPLSLQMPFEYFHQLQRLLEDGITVTVEGDIETADDRTDSIAYNLVAEIPGADPALKDQWVILGAHLDSWQSATGATDNGAGAAVMMEVMRILQSTGLHARRSIRLILWSGEEQGLLGSSAYTRAHYGDPKDQQWTPEQANVSAYYNLDNGSGRIRGIYLQHDSAAGPVFQQWLSPFEDLGASTVTMDNTGGTDHLSFVREGIPGFQFIQDPLEYDTRTHHSNMDTYDHLSENDLRQAACIIAFFVYQTATRDSMIPRKDR